MTESDDKWMHLQGRVLAIEVLLSHLIWRWALDHDHPPTALATYFRPVEEKAAIDAADPASHPAAMRGLQDTIRGMEETLEHALHAQTLLNSGGSSPGKA